MKHAVRTWLTVIPAMLVPPIGAAIYAVILKDGPAAQIAYTLSKLFILTWPILVYFLIEHKRFERSSFSRRSHLRTGLVGLVIGSVFALAITFACTATSLIDWLGLSKDDLHQKAQQLGILDHYILFAVFLSVAHSLLEEYYWRWFLFGRLKSVTPPLPAAAIASVAFAAHHVIILNTFLPPAATLFAAAVVALTGLLWCLLYHKQNSLLACWISHLLADAAIMAVGYQLLNLHT